MKLVYLIVNYNDFTNTNKLINQIKDYKSIDLILVVDNHSKDNSVEKINNLNYKKVEVIVTEDNKGYGYAINYGTKHILKKYNDAYVVISNSDIILSNEKDLNTLVKGLDEKDIGVVGPTIKENGILSRGWKMPTPTNDILENISKKNINKRMYDESHYKGNTSIVDVVSGCFFLMKASIIKKANYFDENIFLYYEENIMAKKLEKLKLKEMIFNNIVFVHNHSKTIDKNIKKLSKYNILKRSQRYFEKKYNNIGIFKLLLLDITRWITYVLIGIKGIFIK